MPSALASELQTVINAGPAPSPSFKGLTAASPASSRAKRMNHSSDTTHECLLRTLLWRRGLRYRKNVSTLPGKPDIVFFSSKVAIFCDGDFWHGKDWNELSRKLSTGANASYWLRKIEANRNRDLRNNQLLHMEGWIVVRLWETDIRKDPDKAVRAIEELVRFRSRGCHAIH